MCGLAGIIRARKKQFDYQTFCTLGVANDTRGGDSCGIFIDGQVEYGVDKNKLFEDFFIESKLLKSVTESQIALVHCRKASVGKITEKTAHPIVIRNDNGEIEFVVIHNGTIYNYEDLAKKYIPDVDIKDMTDSQVMTHIFYHAGYDVLDEYNGGSVFVIVDYRGGKPRTFLFKGASKEYATSTKISEERPLYFYIDEEEQELVFSSIASYLYTVNRNFEVYTMVENTLVEFKNNDIYLIKEYPRTNCTQRKVYTTTYSKTYRWNYYDDPDDLWYQSSYKYLEYDRNENVYTLNGLRANGSLYVGIYGSVFKDKRTYANELWFFDGVLLLDKRCYAILTTLKKKYNFESNHQFYKVFENIVRYLSVDQAYAKNGIVVQAINPLKYDLFTGAIQVVGTQEVSVFKDGIKTTSTFRKIQDFTFPNRDFNAKVIKEACGLLMKSLNKKLKLMNL